MAVRAEIFREELELALGGELAAVEKVHHLLEGALLDEILDVETEITKDPFLALHVTKAGFVCNDSLESFRVFRFVRHKMLFL
jgi:hypothetical protein